ncbi:hypothetical protein IW261DRAFT_1423817 [Armillaria novae-zelandiae]|uniref:Uncharacterized protein n=1 Tax=Armillaria novae-zelandiae TaxID=153914 RepID=A0AA39NW76_9AGAR|nr:hypothetical protein IW261DRAFT_1423817 [Armillaria novae-zelandiae]
MPRHPVLQKMTQSLVQGVLLTILFIMPHVGQYTKGGGQGDVEGPRDQEEMGEMQSGGAVQRVGESNVVLKDIRGGQFDLSACVAIVAWGFPGSKFRPNGLCSMLNSWDLYSHPCCSHDTRLAMSLERLLLLAVGVEAMRVIKVQSLNNGSGSGVLVQREK